METMELLRKKRNDILQITSKYGAHNVRVFGSVARGETDEDSDIDFLVRLEPGSTLLKHAALIRELENLLDRKVDVISERGLRQRIKNRVLTEAISI